MGGGPPQHTDLKALVRNLALNGPIRAIATPKRIRLLFNGAFIADTTSAIYVWEHEYYPQFYLPMNAFVKPHGFDVTVHHGDPITESDRSKKIVGGYLEVAVRREKTNEEYRIVSDMAIFAADLEGRAECLRNYVKIDFKVIDQWFEDDTPIYVHPKDPMKRVDTLQSTTPIRITIQSPSKTANGASESSQMILAESNTSVHLYETSLPPRYYLPYTSLSTIYLRSSKTISECPYKGIANYHHIVVGDEMYQDLVWWYRAPTAECLAVTGMRCFYNEKVDVWFLMNGEWKKQERPQTHFV